MQIAYYRHTKLFFLNVSVLNIKMAKAFFFFKGKSASYSRNTFNKGSLQGEFMTALG